MMTRLSLLGILGSKILVIIHFGKLLYPKLFKIKIILILIMKNSFSKIFKEKIQIMNQIKNHIKNKIIKIIHKKMIFKNLLFKLVNKLQTFKTQNKNKNKLLNKENLQIKKKFYKK